MQHAIHVTYWRQPLLNLETFNTSKCFCAFIKKTERKPKQNWISALLPEINKLKISVIVRVFRQSHFPPTGPPPRRQVPVIGTVFLLRKDLHRLQNLQIFITKTFSAVIALLSSMKPKQKILRSTVFWRGGEQPAVRNASCFTELWIGPP